MLNFRFLKRSIYVGLFTITLALSVAILPLVAQANWLDLLFRGIQVIQLSSISPKQEVQLGTAINQQLVNQDIRILNDSYINQYIDDIGQRLLEAANINNIPYTFQVVADRRVNAFATMGGFVYVNAGLIALAENEAELAGVMGHEIGHIAARHAIKQMRQVAVAQGIASATGLDSNRAVALGVELALRLPRSRQAEFEADRIGLSLLSRAGYAPVGMVGFMSKLQQLSRGASPPSFLSTHPATNDRIVALQKQIPPNSADDGDGLDRDSYQDRIQSLLR